MMSRSTTVAAPSAPPAGLSRARLHELYCSMRLTRSLEERLVVIVCENNGYAFSTPTHRQTRAAKDPLGRYHRELVDAIALCEDEPMPDFGTALDGIHAHPTRLETDWFRRLDG